VNTLTIPLAELMDSLRISEVDAGAAVLPLPLAAPSPRGATPIMVVSASALLLLSEP
jgi:hypothetical protein